MKKWGISVVVLLFALALAACGGQSKETAGAAAPEASLAATATATAAASVAPSASPSPAAPAEVTIKHQLGETKVKTNPKTVAVFDYGTLDSLDKLGIEVAAVPKGNLPPYLKKYEDAKYQNVGTLVEADFEKLSAVKPDLIIISGRLSSKYEELQKLGPTIYLGLDTAKYMESYENNAKIIGQIFGKEKEVEAELAKVKQSVQELNAKVTADGKNALVILTTGGKVSAFGPGSRFGLIHDVIGFKAADDKIESSTHGQSVSFEFVAEKNPDYLFVVDRDAVVTSGEGVKPAKELIENSLVKNTNAYKNGKIVYLDPNYWYLSGGGLLSVEAMIKEVSAGF
ncbi:siderophore ABC transporter substrate-binding protein [Paenibacillus sp. YN15]|uniref:siderophore ABC transporter substrate-binding protein n=1 Tax=Paenibacillus sp. YN15 TaxID=1742774 RepID=UPI000DCC42D0|nr:siderophore ABC transporter substrate-binding protein [Paenibacillus sp. YN15]RAV02081.1 ABC transporter [Paenibacillus sp. YN15]